jgi:hypothetical protein
LKNNEWFRSEKKKLNSKSSKQQQNLFPSFPNSSGNDVNDNSLSSIYNHGSSLLKSIYPEFNNSSIPYFHIIWPTVENVRNSYSGYASGSSICLNCFFYYAFLYICL